MSAIARPDGAEHERAEQLKLEVAVDRLAPVRTRDELFDALVEILVSVLGTETFALYERLPERGDVVVRRCWGLDQAAAGRLALASTSVSGALTRGAHYLRPAAPDIRRALLDAGPVACVPMLDTRGVPRGALLVVQLLAHKPALAPVDERLLSLLAGSAGATLERLAATGRE